jgi:hypothetical protein
MTDWQAQRVEALRGHVSEEYLQSIDGGSGGEALAGVDDDDAAELVALQRRIDALAGGDHVSDDHLEDLRTERDSLADALEQSHEKARTKDAFMNALRTLAENNE